jgi:membrane-bound serine protease (ClpP class)
MRVSLPASLHFLQLLLRGCTPLLVVTVLFFPFQVSAQNQVWLLDLKGAVGPASADYLIRSISRAEESQANVELLIIRIDTPGGLDLAMRDIISAILRSSVPVVSWTAPGGARAASAGTYIMYASHFAAMAPATNIGSSTPVNMGGGNPLPSPQPDPEESAEQREPGSAMERKAINDAVAYLQGLAELRGRNAEWAEQTVREASNLSASEAVRLNVVDLLARDLDELLSALDGRSILINGEERTLNLENSTVQIIEPGWRYEFLSVITNPNVAYILLMIGIYGLILEFYNPGMGLPGIVGIISLLVAAFALQMLPISYAGLALMIVGVALLVFEVLSPSFGVFGVGGMIAFILGSIMLMDTDLPAYQISFPLIAAFAVATAGLIVIILGAMFRSRHARIVSGREAMPGSEGFALEDFEKDGRIFTQGENWIAVTDVPLKKGDRVLITQVNGLTLKVTKKG